MPGAAPTAAAAQAAHSAASSSSPLTALARAAGADRAARRAALDRSVEGALLAADVLENDVKAAVGLQVNAALALGGELDAAVRGLRGAVSDLSRKSGAWAGAYDSLIARAAELPPVEPFLRATDASLARTGAALEAAAARLVTESEG